MIDNRKELERAELHRTIWNIANDLSGSVDGWDFKQYVLGMLFYRYISENFAAYINEGEQTAGDIAFDYAALADSDASPACDDEVNKVYDPACGSGSLLLNFAKILGKENVRQGFFGQEINITTYNKKTNSLCISLA